MEKQIRQDAPDNQKISGGDMDNPMAAGPDVSGSQGAGDTTNDSDLSDVSGPNRDSDEDDSGVSRRGANAGALTGTDNDETGPGENMATES